MERRLQTGEVEQVLDPRSFGVYSTLFLVSKHDGSTRPIIDLKRVNGGLAVPPFKMTCRSSWEFVLR